MADIYQNHHKSIDGPPLNAVPVAASTNEMPITGRCIMVSQDTTVSLRMLGHDDDAPGNDVAFPLVGGVWHPMRFTHVLAIGAGTVIVGW